LWYSRQFTISLPKKLYIGGQRINKLRHNHVRQDDPGHNHIGTRQIPHEIEDVFRTASNDDHPGAHFAPSDMFWNPSTHSRHVFKRIGSIIG
jgi:hypothetical protein